MIENFVGEEDSNNKEETGSPMWRFLREEYDYKRPQRGDIRYAEVVRVDDDEIIVDIGGKTEGVVPRYDLQKMGEEAREEIEVGDKVPVYVLRPESAEGNVIVSLNMARTVEDWRKAEKLHEEGDIFEGTVSGYNKGGLLVYFGRIRGFVPSSQLATFSRQSRGESRMELLAGMEGRKLMLKAIEVDRERRRLIFSERAATREWREKRKEMLLNDLQEGDIRVGTVRNLCDFGAFVDLGGADGLVHISELSWRRVKHPREVLGVGDEVEVYVLRVDRRKKRIGLSLKRLKPDPWQLAEESYHVGQIIKGVITNVVSFGAFARIDDGIEGLIHISQLADGDFSPRDLVKEGEGVYLKILGIDASRKRMSLSLKQAPTRAEMEGREALVEMRAEAAELEEEAPIALEAVVEIEEELEVAVQPEEELEAVVELEEEAPIAVEAVAEIEEELEAAVEPEEELEAVTELEEEAPVTAEAVAEIEEESEVAVEPEEELEAVAELEEEARVAAEAVAEIEEEPEAAVEPEEELEAAAELEVEAAVAAEAVAEAEEELEVAVESEEELEAVSETKEEESLEVEAAAETEEELEAAAEAKVETGEPEVEESADQEEIEALDLIEET